MAEWKNCPHLGSLIVLGGAGFFTVMLVLCALFNWPPTVLNITGVITLAIFALGLYLEIREID